MTGVGDRQAGSGSFWPFVVATKPPDGYTEVLVPEFLKDVEIRGFIGAEAENVTAADTPVVQPVLVREEQLWLVFHVVHFKPASLPPPADRRRSSSSRPVVVVRGCVVRVGERPSPEMVRTATSSVVERVCEEEFGRFWESDSTVAWPAVSLALGARRIGVVQSRLKLPKPTPDLAPVGPRKVVDLPETRKVVHSARRTRRLAYVGAAFLFLVLAVVAVVLLRNGR